VVLQHAGIPINKWAVVMNDDPRVYRAIESVVNEYRYKLFAMDEFKEQWKSWMKKISSCDFPKGRLTGYYSNMVFSLDCLAAFAVCLAHVSHYSHLM
jgi:hypothetical protein